MSEPHEPHEPEARVPTPSVPGLTSWLTRWLAPWLSGGRAWLAAFGLGAFSTLALPPAHLFPVLWLTFPGLLLLLLRAPGWGAALGRGWAFGFGQFLFGLYWIAFALLTDPERLAWLLPLAMAGLPAMLALFPAGVAVAFYALWSVSRRRASAVRLALLAPLLLAVLWAGGEWLRGHVLTGFPWNLTGYAWNGLLPMLQGAAVMGISGLGLVTAVAACLPILLLPTALTLSPSGSPRFAGLACLCGIAMLAGIGGWGEWRLSQHPTRMVEGVTLRLVQGNIPQRLKGDPRERERSFQKYLALSQAPGHERVSHIIWPETAVAAQPAFLEQDPGRRLAMAMAVPPAGLIITGAPRRTPAPESDGFQYWNGLVAVDASGAVRGTFDKFHLVPFGEYMPLRRWLPLTPIAAGTLDFSAGAGPQTLRLPGLPPVSPLICYEVIFPGAVVDAADRPAWMLNLTNDAWYGRTAGPYQHFAISRARAVEEGVPMIRVANTGISGVVDSSGRVIASLGLERGGVIDAGLPQPLVDPPFFARFGDTVSFVLGILFLLMGCSVREGRSPASPMDPP